MKVLASFILSSAFLLVLSLPTVISFVDNTVDVSILLSTSEEEEKEIENHIEIEVYTYFEKPGLCYYKNQIKKNNLDYILNNYSKPFFNVISPPPDFTT